LSSKRHFRTSLLSRSKYHYHVCSEPVDKVESQDSEWWPVIQRRYHYVAFVFSRRPLKQCVTRCCGGCVAFAAVC